MNIPITKRVMTAGSKKGCGCCGACQCGKTPAKKALVGNQDQLPQHLQNAIKAAPGKMYDSPAKQLSKVKEGLTMAGEGAAESIRNARQGVRDFHRGVAKGAYKAATDLVDYGRQNIGKIAGAAVGGPVGMAIGSSLDRDYKNKNNSNSSSSNKEPKKLVGIRTAPPQDKKPSNRKAADIMRTRKAIQDVQAKGKRIDQGVTGSMTKDIKPVRKKVKSVDAGLKPKGINSPNKMWGAAKVAHGKKKSPAKMGCGSKRK
jgi:hypothetical protein